MGFKNYAELKIDKMSQVDEWYLSNTNKKLLTGK